MNHDILLRDLARLKLSARLLITVRQQYRSKVADLTRRKDVFRALGQLGKVELVDAAIAKIKIEIVDVEFALIEDGQRLMSLCAAIDEAGVPRELILNVLGANTAEWDTPEITKYGDKAIHLIAVLDLENSATKHDGIEIKPLKWCHTMAFMNALKTSSKLDRAVHEGANEFFGGAFGDYRERPVIERLAGVQS
ncbi:hypothetical protein PSQ39_06415 [Curvibacter sp. HBC28]|uniref:Uncharacterized protein n=1 Tax=Curvibacter microcysteis TaxID=3026419 RepID=A0ABT5MEG1_9BURK|nr:hypothetical protein [Curvibacter sp. HBC28]MDD0814259.1 hypothetical protein [Curvibacter sp. HBC28]